jgi:hypothetical protein
MELIMLGNRTIWVAFIAFFMVQLWNTAYASLIKDEECSMGCAIPNIFKIGAVAKYTSDGYGEEITVLSNNDEWSTKNTLSSLQGNKLDIDLGQRYHTYDEYHSLTPPTPDELKELLPYAYNIYALDLSENRFNSEDLKPIWKLVELRELNLRANDIDDEGLKDLAVSLKNLQKLFIVYDSYVTSGGIKNLLSLKRTLTFLNLSTCRYIGNKGIEYLSGFESLTDLNVASCGFDDQALPFITKIKTLKTIDISNNKISLGALQEFKNTMGKEVTIYADDLLE